MQSLLNWACPLPVSRGALTLLALAILSQAGRAASKDKMRKAIAHRNTSKVAALLKRDPHLANVECNNVGMTPLELAVIERDEGIAELLLAHGADVNVTRALPRQETPLHYAAGDGDLGIVKLLLAHGANVNARDDEGETPLHLAAANGEVEIIELLLAHGAEVNATDNSNRTPLYRASHVTGNQALDFWLSGKLNSAQQLDRNRQQVVIVLRQHGGRE